MVCTSRMMKNSSPGFPCTTIFWRSSNCTVSMASATVRRSHLSRDSVQGQHSGHQVKDSFALKTRWSSQSTEVLTENGHLAEELLIHLALSQSASLKSKNKYIVTFPQQLIVLITLWSALSCTINVPSISLPSIFSCSCLCQCPTA